MPTDSFDTQLDQAIDFSNSTSYDEAFEALKGIAASIAKKLNQGLSANPIQVDLEPGFQATMGQQLRVNVRIPTKQFRDTLFRAYVPETGWPVQLDLYGEGPEPCDDEQSLQSKVLEFLLRIKERMTSYREYAT